MKRKLIAACCDERQASLTRAGKSDDPMRNN